MCYSGYMIVTIKCLTSNQELAKSVCGGVCVCMCVCACVHMLLKLRKSTAFSDLESKFYLEGTLTIV